MLSIYEILSLIFVGATWGCSNSFLRKGSTEAEAAAAGRSTTAKPTITATTSTTTTGSTPTTTNHVTEPQPQQHSKDKSSSEWLQFLRVQLSKFRHVSVWLPYVVNQSGSLLFYVTLSQTDISIAVPACNALSLVFSIGTSWFVLKEPIERPIHTLIGATLVMVGVAICIQASR